MGALARKYGSWSEVRSLLRRAGLPLDRLPTFDGGMTPLAYWHEVGHQLASGLVPAGCCRLLTVASRDYPRVRVFRDHRRDGAARTSPTRRLPVVLVVTVSLLVATTAGTALITRKLVSHGLAPCAYQPGEGSATYQEAFVRTYEAAGGRAVLGCADDRGVIENFAFLAAHQNFNTDDGRVAAIHATSPDDVFYLTADFLECLNDIAGPAESTRLAGAMTSQPVAVDGGWVIPLGAPREHYRPSAVLWPPDTGSCVWVSPDYWDRYEFDLGGPDGVLGFPVAPERNCGDGGKVQQFEGGPLIRLSSGTVLTESEYQNSGRTGCV